MSLGAYDFKDFYRRRRGRLISRLLTGHIRAVLPSLMNKTLVGYGYAAPYIQKIYKDTDRAICVNPSKFGGHHWPQGKPNALCLSEGDALPLDTESVDCILVVHGFEFADDPDAFLQECWRVLKGHGRLILMVPNRTGLWARYDGSPFGHGVPYTLRLLKTHLKKNLFVSEREERALFMPPFKSFLVLKTAYIFESFGRFFLSRLAGVHILEASKQLYAGLPEGSREKNTQRRYAVSNAALSGNRTSIHEKTR